MGSNYFHILHHIYSSRILWGTIAKCLILKSRTIIITLLVLTEVSGVLLYTFHALNNLIIANMLEVGTIFSPVQMRK